jgi:hypothetical protein
VPASLLELTVGQELKEVGLPASFILEIGGSGGI